MWQGEQERMHLGNYILFRVSQEEKSIFLEIIVSVILSKKM
jgi:hypothetical protein